MHLAIRHRSTHYTSSYSELGRRVATEPQLRAAAGRPCPTGGGANRARRRAPSPPGRGCPRARPSTSCSSSARPRSARPIGADASANARPSAASASSSTRSLDLARGWSRALLRLELARLGRLVGEIRMLLEAVRTIARFAAFTSSSRRTGRRAAPPSAAPGSSAASRAIASIASTNASSVSFASVSVGSIISASGTTSGK